MAPHRRTTFLAAAHPETPGKAAQRYGPRQELPRRRGHRGLPAPVPQRADRRATARLPESKDAAVPHRLAPKRQAWRPAARAKCPMSPRSGGHHRRAERAVQRALAPPSRPREVRTEGRTFPGKPATPARLRPEPATAPRRHPRARQARPGTRPRPAALQRQQVEPPGRTPARQGRTEARAMASRVAPGQPPDADPAPGTGAPAGRGAAMHLPSRGSSTCSPGMKAARAPMREVARRHRTRRQVPQAGHGAQPPSDPPGAPRQEPLEQEDAVHPEARARVDAPRTAPRRYPLPANPAARRRTRSRSGR
jgi:hypothetical protein